jgi:hypothetical protein
MAGCIPTVLRRGVGLFLQKSITLGATRPASRSSTHLKGRGVVDLYGAATQFFGTPTWITLGAALLISTTAFIVMLVYVRAVDPKSKPGKKKPQPGPVVQGGTPPLVQLPTGSLEIQTEKPGGPRSLPPPRSPTFQHAKTFPSCGMFLYPPRAPGLGLRRHASTNRPATRARRRSTASLGSRYRLPSPGSGWCGLPAAIDA